MKKMSMLLAVLLAAAVFFVSCSLFGGDTVEYETDPVETEGNGDTVIEEPAIVPTELLGLIPIDAFEGIVWSTYQDPDGTQIVRIGDQVVTTGDVDFDPVSEVFEYTEEALIDEALTAKLYFDVYFSETEQDLFSNHRLIRKFEQDEWDTQAIGGDFLIPANDLADSIGLNQLRIGQEYYYGVVVQNAEGVEVGTVENSVIMLPPRRYERIELGYDLEGWYITTRFEGFHYDTTIADIYFSTDVDEEPLVIDSEPYNGMDAVPQPITVFKQYLDEAPQAGVTYNAYLVTKDKVKTNRGIRVRGEDYRINRLHSVSAASYWDFREGTDFWSRNVVDGARLVDGRSVAITWADLVPDDVYFQDQLEADVVLQVTADNGLYDETFEATLAAGRYSATATELPHDTTFTAQVLVTLHTESGASTPRTYSSPAIQFRTADATTSGKYNFNDGNTIPVAGDAGDGPADLYTDASLVSYGNPAPALQMAAGDVIATQMTAAALPYDWAEFTFDFRTTSEQDVWFLTFDDAAAPSNFDPADFVGLGYTEANTNESFNQRPLPAGTTLNGPVIALNRTTDSDGDPEFAVYGYRQLIVGGDSYIRRAKLGDLVGFTDGGVPDARYNQYHTVTVTIDLASDIIEVTMDVDGDPKTMADFDFSSHSDLASGVRMGLSEMRFEASGDVVVDNVEYTVEARDNSGAKIPWVRNVY